MPEEKAPRQTSKPAQEIKPNQAPVSGPEEQMSTDDLQILLEKSVVYRDKVYEWKKRKERAAELNDGDGLDPDVSSVVKDSNKVSYQQSDGFDLFDYFCDTTAICEFMIAILRMRQSEKHDPADERTTWNVIYPARHAILDHIKFVREWLKCAAPALKIPEDSYFRTMPEVLLANLANGSQAGASENASSSPNNTENATHKEASEIDWLAMELGAQYLPESRPLLEYVASNLESLGESAPTKGSSPASRELLDQLLHARKGLVDEYELAWDNVSMGLDAQRIRARILILVDSARNRNKVYWHMMARDEWYAISQAAQFARELCEGALEICCEEYERGGHQVTKQFLQDVKRNCLEHLMQRLFAEFRDALFYAVWERARRRPIPWLDAPTGKTWTSSTPPLKLALDRFEGALKEVAKKVDLQIQLRKTEAPAMADEAAASKPIHGAHISVEETSTSGASRLWYQTDIRLECVHKLTGELDFIKGVLKKGVPEEDFLRLKQEHPGLEVFSITRGDSHLEGKVLAVCLRRSTRELAREFAGIKHSISARRLKDLELEAKRQLVNLPLTEKTES